ncbi:MAG TPA: hypothetical protein VF255_00790 [Solirubrobacterales bacterium]
MFFTELLGLIEPGLGRRDQQFFELAATLIPIFFLAGTIASAARAHKSPPGFSHVGFAFALLVFVIAEIFAELVAVETLVSGNADDSDRYFVLAALILAMWVAGFALLWPWVQSFYASRGFRQGAIAIIVTVLVGLVSSGYGVIHVFNVIFDVTEEERNFQNFLNREKRRQERKREEQRILGSANELLRLNLRFARICRVAPEDGWTIDEQLALRLVKSELRDYIQNYGLDRVLRPKQQGTLDWLKGAC